MDIKLKGIKSFQGMDGEAFRANITFDGKVVGSVMNDGWGGPNSYTLNKKDFAALKDAADAAGHKGPEGEDILIEDLMNAVDAEKQAKKLQKKGWPCVAYFIRDEFETVCIGFKKKTAITAELKDKRYKLVKIFGEEVVA
jgi:hypothetical protein